MGNNYYLIKTKNAFLISITLKLYKFGEQLKELLLKDIIKDVTIGTEEMIDHFHQ